MSALERRAPRFCFSPRSIASCKEIESTPGTGLDGTLPANGFAACVDGALGGVTFWENAVAGAAKTNASNRPTHAARLPPAACEPGKSVMPRDGEGYRRLETMGGNYN